jgi:excisionase family DNA binding protein
MNQTGVEKAFCTTREAASLLGVAVSTVQLWVESGLLQAWKTAGGHRRILRASVEAQLRKNPVLPRSQVERRVRSRRRLRIMVLEDDPTLLLLYQAKLAQWPMAPDVVVFDNAVASLVAIGRTPPDLLVMDLHMPGLDGFDMLRVLHRAPEVSNTTIVVVSGLDGATIEQRGGVPSGIEVLPKPVPFDRLLAIATSIVQSGQHPLSQA